MSYGKIQINDNVTINEEDVLYKCTIQDIQEDYYLINIPVADGGNYLIIPEGSAIEIDLVKDGGYFMLKSEIIGKIIEDGKSFYKITVPIELEKIERRDFVRVNLVDYIFYKVNDGWNKAMVLDISGGGMKIIVKEKVNIGDIITVGLAFENESFQLKGTIVRIIVNQMRENVCGIEFVEIDERIREKIISKIFDQLRRQLEFK